MKRQDFRENRLAVARANFRLVPEAEREGKTTRADYLTAKREDAVKLFGERIDLRAPRETDTVEGYEAMFEEALKGARL